MSIYRKNSINKHINDFLNPKIGDTNRDFEEGNGTIQEEVIILKIKMDF